VIEHRFDEATDFSEGMAAVNFSNDYEMEAGPEGGKIRSRGNWGYIDRQGKTVIEPMFSAAHPFRDGLAFVMIGDDGGYIDPQGRRLWNIAEPDNPENRTLPR
jgi:hypothetical protein